MKKYSKYLLLFIITFIIAILPVSAREMTIQELGEYIAEKNEDASFFYLIGEYAYTSEYILDTQDMMLAARSIKVADGGDKKSDPIYGKMTIFVVERTYKGMTPTGWEVSSNYVGNDTITMNSKFDIMYVDYEKVKDLYTVEFNTNGGDPIDAVKVEEGSILQLPTPTKEGYNFVYWYKDREDTEFKVSENPINENITLTAKWEIKSFTLTFDDPTAVKTSHKFTYPDLTPSSLKYTRPNEKEEEDFQYWYDKDTDGTTPFNFDEPLNKDVTLWAKWSGKQFTVTFMDPDSTQTVDYAAKVKRPTEPTKEGYNFKGWYLCANDDCDHTESEAFDFDNTHIVRDTKIKGVWERITYTITFDDDYVTDKVVTYDYDDLIPDDKINFKPDKVREGYDFQYWYEHTEYLPFNFNNKLTKNVTLKAKWEIKKLTITFKSDKDTNYNVQTINYGDSIVSAGEPTKESKVPYNGYVFDNWYLCTNKDCSETDSNAFDFNSAGKNVKTDLTLIAKYKEVVYTNDMITNFVENLKSSAFSVMLGDNTQDKTNINVNILEKETLLSVNYNSFINAIKKLIDVQNVASVKVSYNSEEETLDSSTVSEKFKTIFAALTKKEFTESKLLDLDNTSFTITINLTSDYNNLENKNTVSYNMVFNSNNYETVHNEEELTNALKENKEIIIADDITINNVINITKNTEIDGQNHTLISNIKDNKYLFKVDSNELSLKDLKLKIDTLKPSEFNKKELTPTSTKNTIAIYVGESATLIVNKVDVISDVKVDNVKLTIDSEQLSASNVVINENAAVMLLGTIKGSNLTYQNEVYGSPTIIAKTGSKMSLGRLSFQNSIYNVERQVSTDSSPRVENYSHYYSNDKNGIVISVLYMPKQRAFVSKLYIYNEKLIVPDIFKEDGDNYKYTDKDGKSYTFNKTWKFNNKTYSNDELTNLTVNEVIGSANNIVIVANYNED